MWYLCPKDLLDRRIAGFAWPVVGGRIGRLLYWRVVCQSTSLYCTQLSVFDAHPEHTLGQTKAHMKFCHRQRGYAKSLEVEGDEETKPIAAIISQASSYPSNQTTNQPTYLSSKFYIWTYYHPHQCDDERKNGNKFDISVVQNNIIYICIVEMLYLRRHTRSQYIYASAYINIYIHIHTYVDIYFAYIIIPPWI